MVDRGTDVLPPGAEERVCDLLHEHTQERQHGHAAVLDLTLAELFHVDRTELFSDREGKAWGKLGTQEAYRTKRSKSCL